MGRHLDLTGQRFGLLIVVQKAGKTNANKTVWECQCKCGQTCHVAAGSLRSGNNVSCGCHKRELTRMRHLTHGHTIDRKRTPEHESWRAMRARCRDPNNQNYKYYGARGITVCERWNKFENFLADMGRRPFGQTLDRKDNSGNYEPGNARWADDVTQSRNRRPKGTA